MAAAETQQKQPAIKVKRAELPLSCPLPGDEVWNMHPRVYLPIEKTGEATCPYCGARYVLSDE
ncbi:MAG: zinc-finger domain-containing protein [Pseudomonadota bacterium]